MEVLLYLRLDPDILKSRRFPDVECAEWDSNKPSSNTPPKKLPTRRYQNYPANRRSYPAREAAAPPPAEGPRVVNEGHKFSVEVPFAELHLGSQSPASMA